MSKKPPQNRGRSAGKPPIGRRFQKGQSGNPAGRPKEVAEVRELARTHTTLAIQTLAAIAKKADRDAARVAAANSLLDRGWGRPLTEIEVKLALLRELEARTDDQLQRLAGIAQAPSVAPPAKDCRLAFEAAAQERDALMAELTALKADLCARHHPKGLDETKPCTCPM